MVINYKKELESAAKTMILVHEPNTLNRMIVRTIVQKVDVKHAGILLHDSTADTYILTVSRGSTGLKIPKGFCRMDTDNPLIQFFRSRINREILRHDACIYSEVKKILERGRIRLSAKKIIQGLLYQMEIFDTAACIPSYYRDDLMGILLLGGKKNNRKFGKDELDFFVALASDVAMAIRNAQLFREVAAELEKKKNLFIQTTVALAAAIDAKDHYTHGHTARVTQLSLEIARQMSFMSHKNFEGKFYENLQIASLLHDIGKIGIPEQILNKQAPLDELERKEIQKHPMVGVNILKSIKELEEPVLGVKYHHERFDGTGYPEGLKGHEIPLIAAIISVADTFDAMTTDRPYRKGLTRDDALAEISRVSGKQLDPAVVEALLKLNEVGKL